MPDAAGIAVMLGLQVHGSMKLTNGAKGMGSAVAAGGVYVFHQE